MEYIKIEDRMIPATISGKMTDPDWDNRETKTITFDNVLSYDAVISLFHEGCSWSIVSVWNDYRPDPETGEVVQVTMDEEFDNSEFSMAGPVTNYRDGKVSVKMGKLTDVEALLEDLFGGDI